MWREMYYELMDGATKSLTYLERARILLEESSNRAESIYIEAGENPPIRIAPEQPADQTEQPDTGED